MTDYKNMSRSELLKLAASTLKEISRSLRSENSRAESRAKFHISEAVEILRKEANKNG
jgi:hypothetical protein